MADIGATFQRELERNIRSQRGLDGRPFQPVTIETARNRQRQSNRLQRSWRSQGGRGRVPGAAAARKTVRDSIGGLNFKRLLFTGQFVAGAFRFEPRTDEVRVYASDEWYPMESVTYSDIVRYNNAGSSRVNPRILFPPKIFPVTDAEVQQMSAYRRAVGILQSESVAKRLFGPLYRKQITMTF